MTKAAFTEHPEFTRVAILVNEVLADVAHRLDCVDELHQIERQTNRTVDDMTKLLLRAVDLRPPKVAESNGVETDFLWGAAAIGRGIGRSSRQAYHLLETGQIKSAKRIGGRWVANRPALIRELTGKHEGSAL
jgi:hypothetical protein